MARQYRFQDINTMYHIYSRGNNRNHIFSEHSDYQKILQYLVKAKEKFNFYVLAYVLMPNHYHFLIKTLDANLSKIMQYLNTGYAIYYNLKHKRCGHLFQGRYHSIIIDEDNYYSRLTRYIHMNPVKAKLVSYPGDYKWSSYRGYLNLKQDAVIDMEQINSYLCFSLKEYEKYVLADIENKDDVMKDLYANCILGKDDFLKIKLENFKNIKNNKDFSNRKEIERMTSSVNTDKIVHYIAAYYDKKPEQLYCGIKNHLKAKKIAIYILKKTTALTNSSIGNLFGLSYSAISKIAANIENQLTFEQKIRNEIAYFISKFQVSRFDP